MTLSVSRPRALALMLLSLGTLQACKSTTTEQINPPPPVPVLARPVSVLVIDSANNLPIPAAAVITVRDTSGNLSTVTQNRAGVATAAFTTSGGTAIFQIASTAALPQSLVAVVTATGYATTSHNFTVATSAGIETSAAVVKILDPPAGVTATQASAGTANPGGTTGAAVTVQTNPEPTTGGTASVTIPANTTVTAKDGAPLTGALTAVVVYYNPVDVTSLNNFPSGFSVDIPGEGQGSFLTVGFNSVQIVDSSGRLASNFNQPIAIAQAIPAGTVNPLTEIPIAVGDPIPFWSYDTASGKWQSEGNLIVAQGPSGLLATGEVTHLSYFNLGWFQPQVACAVSPTLTIAGNAAGRPIDIWMITAGYENTIAIGLTASSMKLTDFPSPVKGFLYAYYQGRQVGTLAFTNLCAPSVGPLNVTVPPLPPATLGVTVQKACTEDPTKTSTVGSASVTVWGVLALGGPEELLGKGLTNGEGLLTIPNLPHGTPLTVKTSVGGTPVFADKSITLVSGQTSSLTISASVTCQQTGAGG